METVKHTIENILEFTQVAYEHIMNSKEETKLTYALKRLCGDPNSRSKGSLHKTIKAFELKKADMLIDLAATDEKTKVLLTDPKGNYSYTPENRKELNKRIEDMINEEYEIEPGDEVTVRTDSGDVVYSYKREDKVVPKTKKRK